MSSYMMNHDFPCKSCGKMTPGFPLCLACTFMADPVAEEILPKGKPKLRKAKLRALSQREGE